MKWVLAYLEASYENTFLSPTKSILLPTSVIFTFCKSTIYSE